MPKRKNNNLNDNKFRIIKISRDALFEFIYESVIDKQGSFFDITDVTKVVSHHDINFDTGEYICLIHNDNNETLQLPKEIDLNKLLSKMPDTTKTMYAPNRYVELSLDEIINIQSKEK
jgi:hypothetical protein